MNLTCGCGLGRLTPAGWTAQPVLPAAGNRGYRPPKAPGWAGHMGNAGSLSSWSLSLDLSVERDGAGESAIRSRLRWASWADSLRR